MIDAREKARKLVLGAAWWSGLAALSAPLLAGAGAILMLHRVNGLATSPLGLNSHLSITPEFLDRLLADLKRRGLALVSLDELLKRLPAGGRRAVAITLDDGWLDNLTDALPVFEAHDAPFTVYVAPGLTSGAVSPWWEVVEEKVARSAAIHLPESEGGAALACADPTDKLSVARSLMERLTNEIAEEEQQDFLRQIGALPESTADGRRFMDWDEIRRLSAHPLATIGAHTIHHYNLRRLSEQAAMEEMSASAAVIEAETGMRPSHFAYPYGYERAVGAREVALAREAGFVSAVTTHHGVLHRQHVDHMHALPRISINGNFQRLSYVRTLLSGLTTPLSNGGRRVVTVQSGPG
jgi:peptidoglycan/xylan/chitin deacetylase (PgdA/CDA1 family)